MAEYREQNNNNDTDDELQTKPLEVLYKKTVLKNIAIFAEKHLCWRLFLVKLQAFS